MNRLNGTGGIKQGVMEQGTKEQSTKEQSRKEQSRKEQSTKEQSVMRQEVMTEDATTLDAGTRDTGTQESIINVFQRELYFGGVHEFALEDVLSCSRRNIWHPPLNLVAAIITKHVFANRNLDNRNLGNKDLGKSSLNNKNLNNRHLIAWVGESCWPTPHTFKADALKTETLKAHALKSENSLETENLETENPEADNTALLRRSIFIHHQDRAKRLWSIITLLRHPSSLAVIADGSRMDFAATKRIQFAARKQNALAILLRPPWELEKISAARTRWKLQPVLAATLEETLASSSECSLEWELTLLRSHKSPAPQVYRIKTDQIKTGRIETDQIKTDRMNPYGQSAFHLSSSPEREHQPGRSALSA